VRERFDEALVDHRDRPLVVATRGRTDTMEVVIRRPATWVVTCRVK
jgi:hypothetical protein